ncbi:MAG: hypothetical protein ACRDJO_09265 [Actinomycetota bacterium]
MSTMQVEERLRRHAGRQLDVRVEDIVEPAVWMPEIAYDDPNMDYSRWRDLLFATGERQRPAGGPPGSGRTGSSRSDVP